MPGFEVLNGTSRSIPCASAIAPIIRPNAGTSARSGQTAMAPARIDLAGSGMNCAGSAPFWMPSPSQAGHQPSGALNEKWFGVSSSKLRPQPSHDRCWLYRSTGQFASSASSPTRATRTTPRPRSSAASTESASRLRVLRRITARSMTTSTRCFRLWLSSGGASRLCDTPSTRTRVKPEPRRSSQSAA